MDCLTQAAPKVESQFTVITSPLGQVRSTVISVGVSVYPLMYL